MNRKGMVQVQPIELRLQEGDRGECAAKRTRQRSDRNSGLGQMIGSQLRHAGQCDRQAPAVPARQDVLFGNPADPEDVRRQEDPPVAGVVAERPEVADQSVCDAKVPGGIAGLDRAAPLRIIAASW